jgi:hypothetical protein
MQKLLRKKLIYVDVIVYATTTSSNSISGALIVGGGVGILEI